jgi:hypothetical protein
MPLGPGNLADHRSHWQHCKMTHRANMLLQAIAITVIGSVMSLIMYSTWFRACCMDRLRVSLGIATLPAIFFAMVIGGGVHSATAVHYTIGLIAELLGIWGIFYALRRVWAKRKLQLNLPGSDCQRRE